MVKDVALNDLCTLAECGVFRCTHLLDIEKELFVGLDGVMESGGGGGREGDRETEKGMEGSEL